ncbi:hypothetical protein [Lactiplantibacillus carotarum]|uniref:hypothetical protein n=1 Tax=Lactiplantibacillus carotarum TaxID=2993456 RepID=UPI00298F13D0|nr:hypothetical protein [Lactiplantibacillus carotarum]
MESWQQQRIQALIEGRAVRDADGQFQLGFAPIDCLSDADLFRPQQNFSRIQALNPDSGQHVDLG